MTRKLAVSRRRGPLFSRATPSAPPRPPPPPRSIPASRSSPTAPSAPRTSCSSEGGRRLPRSGRALLRNGRSRPETDGCTSGSFPIGTPVEVTGATRPGSPRLQLLAGDAGRTGETDPRHLRLQRPGADPESTASRRRQGQPVGTRVRWPHRSREAPWCELGSTVYSFGNSELRVGITKLSPKQGIVDPERRQRLEPRRRSPSPRHPGRLRAAASCDENGRSDRHPQHPAARAAPGDQRGRRPRARRSPIAHGHGFPGLRLVPGTKPFKASLLEAIARRLAQAASRARPAGRGGRAAAVAIATPSPSLRGRRPLVPRAGRGRARSRCRRGRRGRSPR